MCVHAQTVMRLVDAIVKQTNTQLSDSSAALQAILAAATNERGEWDLPLCKAKVARHARRHGRAPRAAQRGMLPRLPFLLMLADVSALQRRHLLMGVQQLTPMSPCSVCTSRAPGTVSLAQSAAAEAVLLSAQSCGVLASQALLSNAFAWMRKSSEDKLDGMVALLQKARLRHFAVHQPCTMLAAGLRALALQPFWHGQQLTIVRSSLHWCFWTFHASMDCERCHAGCQG